MATAKVKSLTRPRKALLGKGDYIKKNKTKQTDEYITRKCAQPTAGSSGQKIKKTVKF